MFARIGAGSSRIALLAAAAIGAWPATAGAQEIDGAAIDSVFADIEGAVPGCAVGVVRNQELAYASGYGMANLDYGLPVTPRS